MNELLLTITLGGTITIVVFVVLFSGLVAGGLWYLTRRERRRFKASRVSMAVKLEPIEKMLKQELIKAKSYTKFAITTIEIDNVSEIKTTAGAKFIKDLLEMIAGRAVRQYNYPLTVARYGNNRIVYISKRLNNAKQLKQIEKVMNAMKDPFVNPNGANVNAKCNYSVINFPEAGHEYSAIIRSIELGIADSLRKGGMSIAIDSLADDVGSLNNYLKVKRAIDKGELTVKYTPVINVYNRERIGFVAEVVSGEVDYQAIMNSSGDGEWLSKWLYDEVFMAIDRLIGRSGALIMPKMPSTFTAEFSRYYKERLSEKEAYKEQAVLTLDASTLISDGGALPSDRSIALEFTDIALMDSYNELIKRYKPRYALVDLESVSGDKENFVRQLALAVEPYDTVIILGGIADKSGSDIASTSGVEYVSGSIYGDALSITELIDTV